VKDKQHKNQEPISCAVSGDLPFVVKDGLLHLAPLTTKKEVQCLLGCFSILEAIYVLALIQVTIKLTVLNWDQSKGTFCSKSRLQCKLLFHLHYCLWKSVMQLEYPPGTNRVFTVQLSQNFFFWMVLGFKLSTLNLLGRHPTT
jgi:hypothetical protein